MAISDVQKNVLACCLSRQYIFDALISKGLNASMFVGQFKKIFEQIVKYRVEHEVNEIMPNSLDFDKSLISEIIDWQADTNTVEFMQYFTQLEKEYIKREKTELFDKSADTRQDCLLLASKLIELAELGDVSEETLKELVSETKQLIAERQSATFRNKYMFNDLKHFNSLGHYEPGSLVTLGGGSGHGKSTFALNMTLRWLRRGMKVIYFTNEMSGNVLLTKLVSLAIGVPWARLMNSKGKRLTPAGEKAALQAIDIVGTKDLLIYSKHYTLQQMLLIIKTYKPDVFILDTVNALIEKTDRNDIALGDIARTLKGVAEQTNSLAIIVAQLKDIYGRPTNKDLVKESRQIRDASDYMDFVYREFEQNAFSKREELREVFEIYRVKGRYTGPGGCFMKFNRANGRITEFSYDKFQEISEYFIKNRRKLFKEA